LAGIYVHIPFCRQACHYCNFHFTVSLTRKNELIAALLKEIDIQRNYLQNEVVETIYFGGGTPSLLAVKDLQSLIANIKNTYPVSPQAEITLETNPDDIAEDKLIAWRDTGVNRLSIGIQSFADKDLEWMNRAHTAEQAVKCLGLAVQYFDNITTDLIYGTPRLTNETWKQNVQKILSFNIPHISCYALTVEPKTSLQKLIRQGIAEDINPGKQSEQFMLLMQWLEEFGYEHYEISNFAKPGFRSLHNSSYWQGKNYLGLGPSAHSFNGTSRQWNIANNKVYIHSLSENLLPFEIEILTMDQQLNEYIMTSLRTMEGLNLQVVEERFGQKSKAILLSGIKKYMLNGKMTESANGTLVLTKEGKLFADGIAADLFTI
jgi:oxygen-independent coproporphyrinogen-3 oxidase